MIIFSYAKNVNIFVTVMLLGVLKIGTYISYYDTFGKNV